MKKNRHKIIILSFYIFFKENVESKYHLYLKNQNSTYKILLLSKILIPVVF